MLGALIVSIGCNKKVFGFISGPGSGLSFALACLKISVEPRNCLPTYGVEEENSDRIRGTDDDLPFLNPHGSIEGY